MASQLRDPCQGSLQVAPTLAAGAKKSSVDDLTLRRNFTLLYERLDPSLLIPVLNKNQSYEDRRKYVESYQKHRHAQNAAIVESILHMRVRVGVPDLIIALGEREDQKTIGQQLLKDYQHLWGAKDHDQCQVSNEASCASKDSEFKEMTESFVQLFQDVIMELEQIPNGLDALKRTLSSLVLPQRSGGVVHLVRSQLYTEIKTVRDVLMNLFPFVNPVSFHLLETLTQLSGCVSAAEKVANFVRLRQSKSHVLLCSNEWIVHSTCNDLNTPISSDAAASHSLPFDQLQSSHPHVLAQLPSLTPVADLVRISARIDTKRLSLSGYDSIVTAICGFFLLPKPALIYVGHTTRPLTLCWCVDKEVSLYTRQVAVKVSCELLLAEQGVTNIMIGDWVNYKCLSKKESELVVCAYYGQLSQTPDDTDINVATFNGWTPLMLASAQGNSTDVALLLSAGARVDLQDNGGSTALYHACEHSCLNVVMLLIQAAASVNIPTNVGDSPLHRACDRGNVMVTQLLLKAGANVDVPGGNYWTPLMKASFENHEKVVELLISAGATLDFLHEREGFTALHCACQQGHHRVVLVLIKAGANLDVQILTNEITPLMKAVQGGHTKVVELLLEGGANPNLKGADSMTALLAASDAGNAEIAGLLVKAGADVEAQTDNCWRSLMKASFGGHDKVVELLLAAGAKLDVCALGGFGALHCASEQGHLKVVQLLVKAGAAVDMRESLSGITPLQRACGRRDNEDVIQFLVQSGADVNVKNVLGLTCLAKACIEGNNKIVEILLAAGADINLPDESGVVPIHVACDLGNEKLAELLIELGADLNVATTDGWTSLMKASFKGNDKIVEKLIAAGANLNQKNKDGFTALACACQEGKETCALLLIQAKADINIQSTHGLTALHKASERNNVVIVQHIITAGCNQTIDAQTTNGWTALHSAAVRGHSEVVELLIGAGANVDVQTELDHTALMMACDSGRPEVARRLIQAEAKVNLCDKSNQTALFWASMRGHCDIVKELLQRGADANIRNNVSQSPYDIASIGGHEQVCQLLSSEAQ